MIISGMGRRPRGTRKE